MATKKISTKKVAKETPVKSATSSAESKENVFSKIAKVITQLCVATVAIVVVFAPENVWVLGPIIGSISIMGIALGYFASK
ncbi:MAG: hypothetical protein QG551_100 [Patescibacteria group bacterium]|jgi:hypothetical protein|nr:hypothetical protein [Patescibacteria group bacterium]